jgi:hypothetical protein
VSRTPTQVPIGRGAMRSRDLGEVHELMASRYVDHHSQVVDGSESLLYPTRIGLDLLTDRMTYQVTQPRRRRPGWPRGPVSREAEDSHG